MRRSANRSIKKLISFQNATTIDVSLASTGEPGIKKRDHTRSIQGPITRDLWHLMHARGGGGGPFLRGEVGGREEENVEVSNLGRVVRQKIKTNPRLKVYRGFNFPLLFVA